MHLVFQRHQQKVSSFIGDFYLNGLFVMTGAEELEGGRPQLQPKRYGLKVVLDKTQYIAILNDDGITVGCIRGSKDVLKNVPNIRVGMRKGDDLVAESDKVLQALINRAQAYQLTSLVLRNPLP